MGVGGGRAAGAIEVGEVALQGIVQMGLVALGDQQVPAAGAEKGLGDVGLAAQGVPNPLPAAQLQYRLPGHSEPVPAPPT